MTEKREITKTTLPTATPEEPVVVIGASTAGLFAAYLLAQAGVPVRVFEAAEELGPPARTLIVTGQLRSVLGFVPFEAIVHRTPRIELFSDTASAEVTLREPDLIVEREALVRLLAQKAQRAGADIQTGRRFVDLEPTRDGLVVHLRDTARNQTEHVRTHHLIGADGVAGRVAQAVGRELPPTVPIVQALVHLPPRANPDTTQVWFERQKTPYFFWLIPESRERAAVGLIGESGQETRQALDDFLAAHGLEPLEYQGAQVAFYARGLRPWQRLDRSRIYFVGDAAGHVKVTTVGGVVTGLWGARAAARAILRGTDYGRELRALRRELDLHLLIRRLLDRFAAADYDVLLRSLNHPTIRLLSVHTRDELQRMFLRLAFAQPRLLYLAARALLARSDG